jgi:hypothetical protein
MRSLLARVAPLLLAGCLAAQPPAAPASQSPAAPVAQSTPAPWVFSLDREGLLLDGARVDVTDEEAFKRILYAHWGHEPIMEVSPDVQADSVGRVWLSAQRANHEILMTKSGSFSRGFSTKYLRGDLGEPSQTFHVVGGNVVRFQHFGVPKSATEPGSFESFDWRLDDERSGQGLRAWLESRIKPRDLVLVITPQKLPFGEIARVVGRLNDTWPGLSGVRLGAHMVPVELDSPLERRMAAGSLPPSVIYASMKFADAENEGCYDSSPERKAESTCKIIANLIVEASGAVSSAVLNPTTTIKDPKTLECMLANVRKVRFPKRDGVPPTEASAGFVYRPKEEKSP